VNEQNKKLKQNIRNFRIFVMQLNLSPEVLNYAY